ncbi:MAG: hypothetical protein Q8Q60_02390 [Candidatus Chromulinivorax sp.]|nr:hypothetical protein [Candidatus Chromulinivorax sp.]
MVAHRITGYLWITLGLFCLIFFGGRLFLQLLGVITGFILIFKGLRLLAVDRVVYNYSRNYFDDQFKK